MVLVDMRVLSSPPTWLKQDGYHRSSEQAIARTAINGTLHESFYGIYGKYHDQGSVVLQGNWSKQVYSMWTCFIIPIPLAMVPLLSRPISGSASKADNEGQELFLVVFLIFFAMTNRYWVLVCIDVIVLVPSWVVCMDSS